MSTYMKNKKTFIWLVVSVAVIVIISALSFTNVLSSGTQMTTAATDDNEVRRTITPQSEWIGSEFVMTFTYDTPKIAAKYGGKPSINSYEYIVWDVYTEEVIPVGFEVQSILPNGFTFDSSSRKLTGKVTLGCGKPNTGLGVDCKSFETNGAIISISIPLYATKIGKFNFGTGKFGYDYTAQHSGFMNHSKDIRSNPSLFELNTVTVKGANLILPSALTVFVNDNATINATLDGELPAGASLSWVVDNTNILQRTGSTNTSLSIKATDVGKSVVRATYTYPNGYIGKSNDLLLTTKLPNISLNPTTNELWVYKNRAGTLIQQSTTLTLNQFRDDGTEMTNKFRAVWSTSSNEVEVKSVSGQTASVQAKFGSLGNVLVTGALEGYPFHSKTVPFVVREYPQNMSTPNVVLYMDSAPYPYPILFYPKTANVTGYTMTVLEGQDIVRIENGKLSPLRPGLARIELATENVSRLFPNGDGPEQIIRKFYVQVKSGNDPTPETNLDNGDFY